MYKIYKLSAIIFFITAIFALAQDSVVVQTFTFDSVRVRRAMFKFPDDTKNFRKILMYYTLKCSPVPLWDKYNCGEWDYLTYSIVDRHTGVYDSTKNSHSLYQIGSDSPDTIFYTVNPTTTKYQTKYYKRNVTSTISENEFLMGPNSDLFSSSSKVFRTQFEFSPKTLKSTGMTKGTINRIKLYFKSNAQILKNFTVKIKPAISDLSSFDNIGFTTYYQNDLDISTEGWKNIDFIQSYYWNGFSTLTFDISYTNPSGTPVVFYSSPDSTAIIADTQDNYLLFDGKNDYINCGNINSLNGVQKFTIESWVRIDQWNAWNTILGKADKVCLQIGGSEGQIYCIIRNPDNNYGYANTAIQKGYWNHIAMVYNGNDSADNGKLKLFINGQLTPLIYSSPIPPLTPVTPDPFTISTPNNPVNGGIDEVRIWTEVLPDSIIASWYTKKLDNTHPYYNKLSAYYNFDEGTGTIANDLSVNNYTGKLMGTPAWRAYNALELQTNIRKMNAYPDIKFVQGNYVSTLDSSVITSEIQDPPASITKYKAVNHNIIIDSVFYAYRSGKHFTYDPNGNKIDSTNFKFDKFIKNDNIFYYSAPYEIIDQNEIGRYITPYGINLDLGPDGFTWVYDVTDYAGLLKGNVDFESGNLQELQDVKFVFYKGTPPRNVNRIDKIWGPMRSYSYKSLTDSSALPPKFVNLLPDSKQFKIKARMTGHGSQSDKSNSNGCCEFYKNTQFVYANDNLAGSWEVWRDKDCASNPVYPQGGTWTLSREGWCPGDVVTDFEFDITKFVKSDSVKIGHDISKIPADDPGLGRGNYVTSIELVEYSEPNFNLDAEIYNVITPNDFPLYSRINPVCSNPQIIVRNNGKIVINKIKFEYGVSGGQKLIYDWTGTVNPNDKINISLPASGSSFWLGDGKNIFTVKILTVNSLQDDYPANDGFTTHFNIPDLYNNNIVLWYKTNNWPQNFVYQIVDNQNKIVFSKSYTDPLVLNKDTLKLADGCYTLQLIDQGYYFGLSYWFGGKYYNEGDGSFQIYTLDGRLLKTFNPDCGIGINYSFNLGNINLVQDADYDNLISVYPNPTNDHIKLFINYNFGQSNIEIVDLNGNNLWNSKDFIDYNFSKAIDISKLTSGAYYLRINNLNQVIQKKFIKD